MIDLGRNVLRQIQCNTNYITYMWNREKTQTHKITFGYIGLFTNPNSYLLLEELIIHWSFLDNPALSPPQDFKLIISTEPLLQCKITSTGSEY